MSRLAIIELHKEELKFSAGHFMVFADSSRESMHGHDYQVQAIFHTLVQDNGMAFDCRIYKNKISELCQRLDYRFILPEHSNYLNLTESDDSYVVTIGKDILPFLKKDAIVLPITNVTMEELSYWFVQQLTQDKTELSRHGIQSLMIKVFNGRGESGASTWN